MAVPEKIDISPIKTITDKHMNMTDKTSLTVFFALQYQNHVAMSIKWPIFPCLYTENTLWILLSEENWLSIKS